MAGNLVYLINGSNRGIGRAIVAALLLRPSTTVVAVVRNLDDPTSVSLPSLPKAADSKLAVVSTTPSQDLVECLYVNEVTHLDVVISNGGTSSGFKSILDTDQDELLFDFEANAVGPFKLFKRCWPLLGKSEADNSDARKFVLITSFLGSIAGLDEEDFPSTAYGMSKAAANWLAKKISVEFKNKGLKVGVIHPGWVKTTMGQSLADAIGIKEAPMMDVDTSAKLVLEQIDKLSIETSGKFIMFNGREMPW